jgi:hypothetical protein
MQISWPKAPRYSIIAKSLVQKPVKTWIERCRRPPPSHRQDCSSSKGIGKVTAIALGAAGANVVVNYLSSPAAAEEVGQAIGTDRCLVMIRVEPVRIASRSRGQPWFGRSVPYKWVVLGTLGVDSIVLKEDVDIVQLDDHVGYVLCICIRRNFRKGSSEEAEERNALGVDAMSWGLISVQQRFRRCTVEILQADAKRIVVRSGSLRDSIHLSMNGRVRTVEWRVGQPGDSSILQSILTP